MKLHVFRPRNNERKEHQQLEETVPNFHRLFNEGKSEFTASRVETALKKKNAMA
jgi:hypothetical protein